MIPNGGRYHSNTLNSYVQNLNIRSKLNKKSRCQHSIKPKAATFLLLLLLAFYLSFIFMTSGFFGHPEPSDLPPHPCEVKPGVSTDSKEKTIFEAQKEAKAEGESEFWKQPDGLGLVPCLNFSEEYQRSSRTMMTPGGSEEAAMRRRFLMVVVSGGLNQQRNQIIDAVVVSRILEAALVVPILQVNAVWGDQSEFSDIFDEVHFKWALKDHVRVVSSLPPKYLRTRPFTDSIKEFGVDEAWIRNRFESPIKKHKVMVLRGFDSRLSKTLHSDLQKLRCKVAFEALRFGPAIQEIGEKLAARMAEKGPYLALHLRLEKDVWIRTGCLPGLGAEADLAIDEERKANQRLLTGRLDLPPKARYLAGRCPLRSGHVARLLKGLGAPSNARIYLAGGMPVGGEEALRPLRSNFPNLYDKQSLAEPGELQQFKHKPSLLAALDYIVCLKGQVFMANHGGNMQRAIQGHRAFLGHRKHIRPNKKCLVRLFMNQTSTMDEEKVNNAIKKMHASNMGAPTLSIEKKGRDVVAYPFPECMCKQKRS